MPNIAAIFNSSIKYKSMKTPLYLRLEQLRVKEKKYESLVDEYDRYRDIANLHHYNGRLAMVREEINFLIEVLND